MPECCTDVSESECQIEEYAYLESLAKFRTQIIDETKEYFLSVVGEKFDLFREDLKEKDGIPLALKQVEECFRCYLDDLNATANNLSKIIAERENLLMDIQKLIRNLLPPKDVFSPSGNKADTNLITSIMAKVDFELTSAIPVKTTILQGNDIESTKITGKVFEEGDANLQECLNLEKSAALTRSIIVSYESEDEDDLYDETDDETDMPSETTNEVACKAGAHEQPQTDECREFVHIHTINSQTKTDENDHLAKRGVGAGGGEKLWSPHTNEDQLIDETDCLGTDMPPETTNECLEVPREASADKQTQTDENDYLPKGTKAMAKRRIGAGGGEIELYGFKLLFPQKAVKDGVDFELTVDNDYMNYPSDKGVPIAPIFGVSPSMKFDQDVEVQVRTWYSAAKGEQEIAQLLTKEGDEDWNKSSEVALPDVNKVTFKVNHFCSNILMVSKERSRNGFYYILSDIYMHKVTGLLISAFYRDQAAQEAALEEFQKSGFHKAYPIHKDLKGKLNSVFKVKIETKKPEGVKFLGGEDASVVLGKELYRDRVVIDWYPENLPDDYSGRVRLDHCIYRVTSDSGKQVDKRIVVQDLRSQREPNGSTNSPQRNGGDISANYGTSQSGQTAAKNLMQKGSSSASVTFGNVGTVHMSGANVDVSAGNTSHGDSHCDKSQTRKAQNMTDGGGKIHITQHGTTNTQHVGKD